MTAAPALPPDYTPHARAERVIAAGRFVLAASSLIAVFLEPSTPVRFQRATYGLLLVYTLYALALAVLAWRATIPPERRWRLFLHALDLVLFSVFVYLTEGPASPFFLYFIFSLFCATLRFSWRGILATGIAAMSIYGAMAAVASLRDPHFEISRVLIRETYLGVIAALLVYLGLYHERLRQELTSLAAWPRELAQRVDDVLQAALAHAASVMSAPRVLLLWEEREEPWQYAAVWSRDDFHLERLPPSVYEPPETAALRNRSFFVRGPLEPILLYDAGSSTTVEWAADPIDPHLRTRYAIGPAIVVSLESQTLTAEFIIPEVRSATADDLALAHIAGRLVLATVEQFLFVQQVRQTASTEERMRISRELHDGIVQSLGGVGLRLQALSGHFAKDPVAVDRLAQVQRVIEHDQRELRAIVRELRPHDPRDGRAIVTDELQRMRERFALEWGMDVDVSVAEGELPARVAHEVCRIANESLSNAARHGGATHAKVAIAAGNGHVGIRVADNGRGFSFAGRYDLDALEISGMGPRTLKERVKSLRGSLAVESSASGAVIDVAIPIREEHRS
ncbi:MAG: sensor histidine kinase [Thermoanaerobaculia bacterium]